MSDQQSNSNESKVDKSVLTLSRPFVFEGETITELRIDFDKLVGDDLILAERRYNEDGNNPAHVKELNKAFQAYIVAAAANVPVELIRKLPAKDFVSVTLDAQNFLLR